MIRCDVRTAAVIFLSLVFLPSVVMAQVGGLQVRPAELGTTRNVHAFGSSLLCGQPSQEDLAEAKGRGIEVVITLREEGEIDWDEAAAAADLGLEFHALGFRSPESLTDEIFDKSLRFLVDADARPVMLHCGSANRVGAIWMAHRVINDQVSVEQALQEAKEVGLRTKQYEERALEYIEAKTDD